MYVGTHIYICMCIYISIYVCVHIYVRHKIVLNGAPQNDEHTIQDNDSLPGGWGRQRNEIRAIWLDLVIRFMDTYYII